MLLSPALPVISHPLVRQTPSYKSIDFWVEEHDDRKLAGNHDRKPARVRVRVQSVDLLEQEHPVGLEPEVFLPPRNECTWQYPMTNHCRQPLQEVGVLFFFFLEAGQ